MSNLDEPHDDRWPCDVCGDPVDRSTGQYTADDILCRPCIEKAERKANQPRQDAIPQTFDLGESGA